MSDSSPPEAEPIIGWKRVQLVLAPGPPVELRFAGPVEAGHPYRADDTFRCPRGHRRVEPTCTCGFYAVRDPTTLAKSVARTAVVEVALEGRVVVHRHCLRAERQVIRHVIVDGWCAFCLRPAEGFAAVRPLFAELPEPWHHAVPVCAHEAVPLALSRAEVTEELGRGGATLHWDTDSESAVALSLRRLTRARRGAAL